VNYRAVFFDAGETLLAPHPSFAELFAEVLGERGHEVAPPRVEEAFEAVAPYFVEVLDRIGADTWSTSPEVSRRFWRAVYRVAFEELGISDDGDHLAEALYERFTRYESYRLFPDALPVLHQAREAGLTVGLISNFEEWLEGMLHHWEVGPMFHVMVISGKEGIEKPHPEIFRLALKRAEVDAGESLYVGDHPRIDIEAAQAVGMDAVLIDRRGRHRDHPGRRITSLNELMPLLESDPTSAAGRRDA
jgi:putative hydrolase of the HAD superfamily